MSDVDTAEMLARDLENLAKRLRNENVIIEDVQFEGSISQTKKETYQFELEWY